MSRVLQASGLIFVLSAVVGAFLGVGAYTLVYAEAGSYLSSDPRACVNCHIMRDQYQAWQHSSHHAVATCNDCHVPHDFLGKYLTKAKHGYAHSKGFTLQDFHEPIQIKPEDLEIVHDNCRRCHEAMTSEINRAGAGHEQSNCTHCHFGVGHGPVK
ncbi:MAG: cytochrome c nitrite reductase small subunit [Phycisphaerales bacterium]|nr:cytochrome c nitrite reductase small subunit [Phycisphaerales bacterium]